MIIAFVVGLAATGIAVLIGVAAAYLGGLWDGSLSLLTDVLLVIPLFPLLIIIAGYAHGGGTLVLILVITVTSWSYTRAGSCGRRRCRCATGTTWRRARVPRRAAAVHHRGGGHPHHDLADRGELPDQRAVRGAVRVQPAVHRPGRPEHAELGTMLYWAQKHAARQTGQPMWALAPGACIAALGAAFALLNYAFDENRQPRGCGRWRRKRVTRA